MSTYTRAKGPRQFRHPGSRSKSHKHDKQQGERRKDTTWLGVNAPPRPSPRRNFAGLEGHEYTYDGRQWRRCRGPEELGDYLEAEAKRRSFYRATTSRKGVVVEMLRRVEAPVDVLTTTFAPWLSDWLAAELSAQRDPRPKLAAMRNKWLECAQSTLKNQRYVLAYAFHADTDDPHFDLCCSRQDGHGGRTGATGLHTVGPWAVGAERQVRAGARINESKRQQLRKAVAKFRRRYADPANVALPVPLDIKLARALDAAADAVLGAELQPYRESYAKRVPELERQHALAQLAAIETAANKLRERTTPPTPEPEPDDTLGR